MSDGEMNFFSVSSDGRIFNWILLQNQLQKNLILNLYLAIDPVPAPDGNLIQLKGKKKVPTPQETLDQNLAPFLKEKVMIHACE